MNNTKEREQDNWVSAGFNRLDTNLITKRPPKIRWGMLYKNKTKDEKICYLEKLASTMNHAAALIQGERDEFSILCGQKEKQLHAMATSMRNNNEIMQQEITRMNEQRQYFAQEVACLKVKLRGTDH